VHFVSQLPFWRNRVLVMEENKRKDQSSLSFLHSVH
jgi:hypothetical protein